jgi:hypothetical protein
MLISGPTKWVENPWLSARLDAVRDMMPARRFAAIRRAFPFDSEAPFL